ncbi:MAG TPA: transglycosylase SLT domain-containing protein [Methylophilaceae bacterium]
MSKTLSFYLLAGLIFLAGQCHADDTLIDDAYTAYKNRDDNALIGYTEKMRGQPLAAYPEYWRLLLTLDQTDSATIDAFLARYSDTPFAEKLRQEWLKSIGKQQNWTLYLAELPKLTVMDTANSCYAALAQSGDKAVLQNTKPLWFNANDLPSNCDDLFNVMHDKGVIKDSDVWARLRLIFQANHMSVAKSAASYLSKPPNAAILKLFDRAYEDPQRILEKKTITTQTRLGRELNLYALERVARSQPDLAAAYWEKIHTNFSKEDQQYAWGRLALQAARNHNAQALAWYKQSNASLLDNEQLAWKARAALRAVDWDALTVAIADMPPVLQEDATWRYWKARALKESGNQAAADALLLPLSKERNFYGQLALEEIGEVVNAPAVPYHASEADVSEIEKLPAIQRASILYRHGLRWESRQEWLWAVRNMDDKHLIAAAEYASRQEWYDLAINTADKTQVIHDFALRYPTPYRDQMKNYARANQLDEAWVYGLIRQESRFITASRSGVGAAGLMQVMPATARWIAKKIGFGQYQPNMIHELDTNIQFGTFYLRHILEVTNGQSVMATAAYNAGPGRAKRWVDDKPLEGAVYIETIPFLETRDYVKKVMSNAQYYAQRLGTQMQTIKQRLGTVTSVANIAGDATDVDETKE